MGGRRVETGFGVVRGCAPVFTLTKASDKILAFSPESERYTDRTE